MKKNEVEFSFDVKGFIQNENGEYVGMIMENGCTFQYRDKDGNPIPFSKEKVEKFLRENNT